MPTNKQGVPRYSQCRKAVFLRILPTETRVDNPLSTEESKGKEEETKMEIYAILLDAVSTRDESSESVMTELALLEKRLEDEDLSNLQHGIKNKEQQALGSQ